MIIEIGNFLDTTIFDEYAKKEGLNIFRPKNKTQIIDMSEIANIVLVFYYNFEQLQWLLPTLETIKEKNIKIINPLESIKTLTDYYKRSIVLSNHDIKIPNFFYGKTKDIPDELGNYIVYKSNNNNLVVTCKKNSIHSLYDNIFVESKIPNPTKKILTIYCVDDLIYARYKEDALQIKQKERSLVKNIEQFKKQIETAKRIKEIFSLVFFNVEFIGEYVVDVNSISNIFYKNHPEPILKLINYIKGQN